MLCLSGHVFRNTGIISSVSRLDRFYREEAYLLPICRYQYTVTGAQSVVVKQPDQLDGRVPFRYGTSDRGGTVDIKRIISELKGHDNWRDFWGKV